MCVKCFGVVFLLKNFVLIINYSFKCLQDLMFWNIKLKEISLNVQKVLVSKKQFSVTLRYYSTEAYYYVRQQFKDLQPHSRTLKRWYTTENEQPGFTREFLDSRQTWQLN